MQFKTTAGNMMVIPMEQLTLNTSFKEIKDILLSQMSDKNQEIIFVNAGHTVSHTRTIADEELELNSTVVIVTRPVINAEPEPTRPASVQDPAQTSVPSVPSAPSTAQHFVLNRGEEAAYTCSYSGADIKRAMDKCPVILFNVIQLIARQNPFFLSYIAINPIQARDHISETLNSDEFKLTVKGDDVTCDPIKPILMHPSGDNGFVVDNRNVSYIIAQTDLIETDATRARAKDLYLLHNRDIKKTLEGLSNPDNTLVMGSGIIESEI